MSLIKTKFHRNKARRIKLSNRNKLEYLHNQLKKTKDKNNTLLEQLDDKEEERKFEEEKVNDLKKHVECPVCLDVPRKAPVFSCPNGHLVCQKCKSKSCPTCRVAMGDNKSLVAIAVIEKILHDCQFVDCNDEHSLAYIEQHEKYCFHRLVACPYYGECDARVPLAKIMDHLEKKPCSAGLLSEIESAGIAKYQVSNMKKLDNRRLSWGVRTYIYKERFLALYVNKSGENWQFIVVMSDPPEDCSEFNIKMEVYEIGSDPDTRLSAKVRCHPCSIDQPVAEMKGLGLYVHHSFMKKMMLQKDSFKFTVSFSFF